MFLYSMYQSIKRLPPRTSNVLSIMFLFTYTCYFNIGVLCVKVNLYYYYGNIGGNR